MPTDDFMQNEHDSAAYPDTSGAADAPDREASYHLSPNCRVSPGGRDLSDIVPAIRAEHEEREFAMDIRIYVDNRMLDYLRKRKLGWKKSLPEEERDAIKERAKDLVAVAERIIRERQKREDLLDRTIRAGVKPTKAQMERLQDTTPVEGADDPVYRANAKLIEATVLSRRPFDEIEASATKEMIRLAHQLPVYPWSKTINGFGSGRDRDSGLSLAQIVAEAGLVSCDPHGPAADGNFPNPAKLWKRLCVAVLDGKRQGNPGPAATKKDWIEHGYSGERRAVMSVIGDNMIRAAGGGYYRSVYDQRKIREIEKAKEEGLIVLPQARIDAKLKGLSDAEEAIERAKYRSEGQIHKRAKRYMEKRLLRDLWRAWREAAADVAPRHRLPPAD